MKRLLPCRRAPARSRSLIVEQLEDRALLAAVITVNSTLDTNSRDGVLTLREAILVNNRSLPVAGLTAAEQAQISGTPTNADTDTIAFNIPGTGVRTITPTSALPNVNDPVVVDGYTQPGAAKNSSSTGWNGQLLIELDGSNVSSDVGNANGLVIAAGKSTVRGLVINRFRAGFGGAGIVLSSIGQDNITGNLLGTDATGTIARSNSIGLSVSSNANTIGGDQPDERNIISGNPVGVFIARFVGSKFVQGNAVSGNYIGTNASGTAALSNGVGIEVESRDDNLIGGTANVISGNTGYGIWLTPESEHTNVQGNLIGTDATGTVAVANDIGISIDSSDKNVIGGTAIGAGNVVSGNTSFGLKMQAISAPGQINSIEGNRIGTDISGTLPLANGTGIYVGDEPYFDGDPGGIRTIAGNTIAFNEFEGVSLGGSPNQGNSILGNSIFSNGNLGIDLCAHTHTGECGNGINVNDPGDGDGGPNNFQNYPEFTVAHLNAGLLTLQYSVPSTTAAAAYPLRIEFFKADSDGQEGQTFLGFDTYISAFAGDSRTLALKPQAPLSAGDRIVATATDNLGNTSEFSASVDVQARICSTDVINTNDDGPGSLRDAITCANNSVGPDAITFNIPGSGAHTISPASALPIITDDIIIDGYTQPGASPNTFAVGDNAALAIELSGVNLPAGGIQQGLNISTGIKNVTIRGLAINNFPGAGIWLSGRVGAQIQGNFIGTNITGTAAAANGSDGIAVSGDFSAATAGVPNLIGGTTPAARNIISGNTNIGIDLFDTGSDGLAGNDIIQGNYIGTNASGTAAIPNGRIGNNGAVSGVFIDANGVQIGGTADGAGNVISGNTGHGIMIFALHQVTVPELIQGNWIGTDATGQLPLGNTKDGIYSTEAALIGGTTPTSGNIIAFNEVGIAASGASVNTVVGNSIFSNTQLGIDLGNNGPTPNDTSLPPDADTGPNNLQNFPEISSAVTIGSQLSVTYSVPSDPANSQYPLRIEFFKADAGGTQGQTFLGSDTYTDAQAGAAATALFTPAVPVAVGDRIVATATDNAGNTSEFSAAVTARSCTEVVNTDDSGSGSLRDAIICANSTPGTDTITFNIPGDGVHTISLYQLDAITDPVIIDGYTQPGASPNTLAVGENAVLLIELSKLDSVGLNLAADNSTVRGLVINGFNTGVLISGSNDVIEGNFIGTDATGSLDRGNRNFGVATSSLATNNTIGGTTPASRNLISGNDLDGIFLNSKNNLVLGNYVGTSADGTTSLANGVWGISVSDNNNIIGGTGLGAGNVISGNQVGILLESNENQVLGNRIGLAASGAGALGNSKHGVVISGDGNTIGGAAAGAGNIIARNGGDGIWVLDGTANSILGNSIFSNVGLGINLDADGATPNDLLDADSGPNNLQNFPVITYATRDLGNLKVKYSVPSAPANSTYPLRVEFFLADATGQGKTYLGFDTFTDADFTAGEKTLTFATAAPAKVFDKIVATATDSLAAAAGGGPANTSEFSPSVTIVSPWQNPGRLRWDVNDDESVSADDVLAVINYINSKGSGLLPDNAKNEKPYIDVDGDNNIVAMDVVDVINYINAGRQLGGEAEATDTVANNSPSTSGDFLAILAADVAAQTVRKRRG